MIWRIGRRNSIIKRQGYRVSASRLAESFRYTQPATESATGTTPDRDWVKNTARRDVPTRRFAYDPKLYLAPPCPDGAFSFERTRNLSFSGHQTQRNIEVHRSPPARAGWEDIELARMSQEVTEGFCLACC